MAEPKKKIRPGLIELHGDEAAIIVHYELQEVLQQPDGSQTVTSSSHATKKVTVKSLNERTDLPALAADIVDKCKLIHPSKAGFIQDLLLQLQQRQLQAQQSPAAASASPAAALLDAPGSSAGGSRAGTPTAAAAVAVAAAASVPRPASAASGSGRPASAGSRPGSARGKSSAADTAGSGGSSPTRMGRQQQQQQQRLAAASADAVLLAQQQQLLQYVLVPTADIWQGLGRPRPALTLADSSDDLDCLLEGLYEDELSDRAAAAGRLAQLFRDVGQFEVLLGRETLLPTLARLLREDGLKSLELAAALGACFCAASCLAPLHRLLLDNQVGSLLMDLVALELQRSAAREAEGPGAAAAAITARAAAAAAGRGPPLDERESRLLAVVVRQDRFLYVATATLMNLAEDAGVQRKMRKKDVVGLLVGLLGRPTMELLLVATSFLRRLTVFVENKDRLAALPGVVPALLPLTQPGCGQALQTSALRLLHNLSFDAMLRQQMIQAGLVPLTVQLLDSPATAPLAAGLLYQLSLDDGAKGLFVFCPGALHRLHESIMRALGAGPAAAAGMAGGGDGFAGFSGALAAAGGAGGDLRSVPELIALAVNLAHSKRTAEWYCVGERLERLLRRALAVRDELAWKLLHNLAAAGGHEVARRLLGLAGPMMDLLQSPNTGPELFCDVLGTLAAACDALSSSSGSADGDAGGAAAGGVVVLSQLVEGEDLLALLRACLAPGALEDDALLEAVVLLGALAGLRDFDAALADSGLLERLVELMAEKRADDEFVLQVCWAFSRSLMQPATSAVLLDNQQVLAYLVDLLQDSCGAVRRLAGCCLDRLMDTHQGLAGTIRSLKFEAHNTEWLGLAGLQAQHGLAAAGGDDGWQLQQQQQSLTGPRRGVMSGYAAAAEQSSCQQQQCWGGDDVDLLMPQQCGYDDGTEQPEAHSGDGGGGGGAGLQAEGSQVQKWLMTPGGGAASGLLSAAGGQRMVLDLGDLYGGDEGGELTPQS